MSGCRVFLSDAAWAAGSERGTAAWVLMGVQGHAGGGVVLCILSSYGRDSSRSYCSSSVGLCLGDPQSV